MRRALITLIAGLVAAAALPLSAPAEQDATLDEALLGQMLEAYVRSNATVPVSAIEIPSLEKFARADVDEFDVSVSAPPSQPMEGWVPLEVAVSSEGEPLESGVVQVHVDAERPVVVANRALRMGAVISAADLKIESRPRSGVPEEALTDPAHAVGLRLNRSLAAGRPLLASRIEPLPVVRRGQQVKLQLRHGRLRIETYGRAQQDGRPGEWVRVRSVDTNREITGRVDADGVVHVGL